ncbi:MAG: hypothetical protein LBQ75_06270, partial [Zoogloeaceae bacterium]|nr:hypothetical protein [Zoogloeaceae bacterium]
MASPNPPAFLPLPKTSSDTLSWQTDLKHFSLAIERQSRKKGTFKTRIFYQLEWTGTDTPSSARITLLKGMDIHDARPWAATERIVTYPPRFIEEEDIFILRQLLLLPRLHGKGQNVFLL